MKFLLFSIDSSDPIRSDQIMNKTYERMDNRIAMMIAEEKNRKRSKYSRDGKNGRRYVVFGIDERRNRRRGSTTAINSKKAANDSLVFWLLLLLLVLLHAWEGFAATIESGGRDFLNGAAATTPGEVHESSTVAIEARRSATTSSGGWKLYFLNLSVHPLATCLDGSPGAYYIRQGTGPPINNRRVRVQLQGGGWCSSILKDALPGYAANSNCLKRSGTARGSTRNDKNGIFKITNQGRLSQDGKVNPTFHQASMTRYIYVACIFQIQHIRHHKHTSDRCLPSGFLFFTTKIVDTSIHSLL